MKFRTALTIIVFAILVLGVVLLSSGYGKHYRITINGASYFCDSVHVENSVMRLAGCVPLGGEIVISEPTSYQVHSYW